MFTNGLMSQVNFEVIDTAEKQRIGRAEANITPPPLPCSSAPLLYAI
jgi:hypothetical protein